MYKLFSFEYLLIFQDKEIKNAVPVLHLIDVLKPGSIDYGTVKTGSYIRYGILIYY